MNSLTPSLPGVYPGLPRTGYAQWLGRFTQRDPEPGSAYEPLSYNRYVYVADNLANYADVAGRQYIDFGTFCAWADDCVAPKAGATRS